MLGCPECKTLETGKHKDGCTWAARHETKKERLRVSTSDGKYTVIQEWAGNLKFLRHGEDWPAANEQFQHNGMILALAQDIEELRNK